MRHSIRSRKAERPEGPRRFSMQSPLLAALAACTLLSCDPKIPPKPEPPKIPETSMAAPKKETPASKPASMEVQMAQPDMAPADSRVEARKKPVRDPECSDNLCKLHKSGYRKIAELISFRTRPYKKKMKLTQDEADKVAGYLVKDLPSMRHSRRLLNHLPKTTVELVRSVNERGVAKEEGEKMALYLFRFLSRVSIRNKGTFDECMSHVIGREWHQIDYSGEGMTWQGQKKFYAPAGVHDLKTALHLHRYLKVEVKLRYFKKLFNPRGRLPYAPE